MKSNWQDRLLGGRIKGLEVGSGGHRLETREALAGVDEMCICIIRSFRILKENRSFTDNK